jgi:hypothetical protein
MKIALDGDRRRRRRERTGGRAVGHKDETNKKLSENKRLQEKYFVSE